MGLYYLPDDFSQAHDLAAQHPEKLKELKDLFWEEAEKYDVLPLLAGFSVFFGMLPPPPEQTKFTYYGDVQNVASGMIPPSTDARMRSMPSLKFRHKVPRASSLGHSTTSEGFRFT